MTSNSSFFRRPLHLIPEFDRPVMDEINKRMTMNMIIQGAAWQACLTVHHLIKDELDALDPGPNPKISNSLFYDRFSSAVLMSQWNSELVIFTGFSSLFWRRVGSGKTAFCKHPLLVKHGRKLAKISKWNIRKRCFKKGVWGSPVALSFHAASLLIRCVDFEKRNCFELTRLAKKATALAWGIEESMLSASITEYPEFGNVRVPSTKGGKTLRKLMVGWGGVQDLGNDTMRVVGKSKYWSLLLHELSKGTVELLALHGLNELDDETFEIVNFHADQIEFEIWMMQAGWELYQRLLEVLSDNYSIGESIMSIAKMPARVHEQFMLSVIENPQRARAMLSEFML